jgi:phosphate transport system permease protein
MGTSMTMALSAPPATQPREEIDRARALAVFKRSDVTFYWAAKLAALLVLALLGGIIASLIVGAWPAMREFGFGFLTTQRWAPQLDDPVMGALGPLYGTLTSSLIAILIAVPVGLGIAIFLTEFCPIPLRRPIALAIELLAGIPSIIYGMWGFFVLMPVMREHLIPWLNDHIGPLPVIGALFQGPPIGAGMLTSGIVLSIMVIPFISSVMREVFLTVPSRLKESAYALGATKWEVSWDIVLPYTRSAVIGGVFLGLGRALGETMAVAFVIGNSVNFTKSLLEPSTTIAALIANDFGEATEEYRAALLLLGFVLFIVTFVVLAIARLMLMQLARKEGNR